MSRDVIHRWEPSARLRRLMERQQPPPPPPVVQPDDRVSAHQWVRDNTARFSSKHRATAIAHIVYRNFGQDLTLTALREKVRRSWVERQLVQGELQGIHNFGVATFQELQRVLGDGHD